MMLQFCSNQRRESMILHGSGGGEGGLAVATNCLQDPLNFKFNFFLFFSQ